jgi:hypothetical protein
LDGGYAGEAVDGCQRRLAARADRQPAFRRNELSREISGLTRRLEAAEPAITPDKMEQLAFALHKQLPHGLSELRQAFAGLVLNEVNVMPEDFSIESGATIIFNN